MATNTFPNTATPRIIGPASLILISTASEKPPLTVADSSEANVFQVAHDGHVECLEGWFFTDVDSILNNYVEY